MAHIALTEYIGEELGLMMLEVVVYHGVLGMNHLMLHITLVFVLHYSS